MTPIDFSLIEQKKWREFLLNIPPDRIQFEVRFPSLQAMKSFKSTAYEINSDGVCDRIFSVSMDKANNSCTVTLRPRT